MTIADDQLAEIGAELDVWDREDASSAPAIDDRLPDCVREALASLEALGPIIPIAIRLGVGQAPSADALEDASWVASIALARRNVLAQRAAGIDHGLANDSLRLLDRIDAMVGKWSDDWGDVARRQVQELVDAGRRGSSTTTTAGSSAQAGVIETTANGGRTWTAQQSGTRQDLQAVQFSDRRHGWIQTDGEILRTADGGAAWTRSYNAPSQHSQIVAGEAFLSPTLGWAAGSQDDGSANHGVISDTSNGGQSWTTHDITNFDDVASAPRSPMPGTDGSRATRASSSTPTTASAGPSMTHPPSVTASTRSSSATPPTAGRSDRAARSSRAPFDTKPVPTRLALEASHLLSLAEPLLHCDASAQPPCGWSAALGWQHRCSLIASELPSSRATSTGPWELFHEDAVFVAAPVAIAE